MRNSRKTKVLALCKKVLANLLRQRAENALGVRLQDLQSASYSEIVDAQNVGRLTADRAHTDSNSHLSQHALFELKK